MNNELLTIAIVAAFALIVAIATGAFIKHRKKPLDKEYFQNKWQSAQKMCGKKDTWPLAVINADKLLDEALKKSHYKGKTMGERLVAAQRQLSDNDGVWFAHKLRNKLVHEPETRLAEDDVRDALKGIRQALRDLGALPQ